MELENLKRCSEVFNEVMRSPMAEYVIMHIPRRKLANENLLSFDLISKKLFENSYSNPKEVLDDFNGICDGYLRFVSPSSELGLGIATLKTLFSYHIGEIISKIDADEWMQGVFHTIDELYATCLLLPNNRTELAQSLNQNTPSQVNLGGSGMPDPNIRQPYHLFRLQQRIIKLKDEGKLKRLADIYQEAEESPITDTDSITFDLRTCDSLTLARMWDIILETTPSSRI